MQQDSFPLGSAFSDWTRLTEEYASGMDALWRREPGASSRMMEIADRMKQYGVHAGSDADVIRFQRAPERARMVPRLGWVARAAQMLSGERLPDGGSCALIAH